MKHRYVGLLALMLIISNGVRAETTDLDTINHLASEGKVNLALEKLNARIAANSSDMQARFLKGLLLLQQDDNQAARAIFLEISQQFPSLPEPFNNLAAIYARQGEYEKAREALLSAAASAPDYPIARANLGDLYVNLALTAYRKAVQLNPNDQASQAKLKLLEKLFAPGG